MNLADMRARVREDLRDPLDPPAIPYWTDDEVDGAITRAVSQYSLACPQEKQDDIATTSGNRKLIITSLADLIRVERVEFPIGLLPPWYQHITHWGSLLYMESAGTGDDARVRWLKSHAALLGDTAWAAATAYALGDLVISVTSNGFWYECTTAGTSGAAEPTWPTTAGGTVVDGTATWTCLASTIPPAHEEFIVLGATGYLAISAAINAVDRATTGGTWTAKNFQVWGTEKLGRFKAEIKSVSRGNSVRTSQFQAEE